MYWKKHSIYRVWFYPDFQAFTEFGTYAPGISGDYCTKNDSEGTKGA